MPLLTLPYTLRHLLRSLLCCLFAIATATAAEKLELEAPTFDELAKAIDLRKFKLPKGPKKQVRRQLASVCFEVAGDRDELWEDLQKQLLAMGCTKVEQREAPADNFSGDFEKDDFRIHASAYLMDDGRVRVTIENQGKIDLSKLPNFQLTDPNDRFFSATRSFGDQPMESSIEEVKLLLQADGFEHLATTENNRRGGNDKDDSRLILMLMRKNTTLLNVYAKREETPTEHTRVAIASDVDSIGLPMPPDTHWARYDPQDGYLSFETKWKAKQIVKFYDDELSKRSWSKLQNDAEVGDFSDLGNPGIGDSYIKETFGKANVGRIVVTAHGDGNEEEVFRVWVTYESAEDFYYSD